MKSLYAQTRSSSPARKTPVQTKVVSPVEAALARSNLVQLANVISDAAKQQEQAILKQATPGNAVESALEKVLTEPVASGMFGFLAPSFQLPTALTAARTQTICNNTDIHSGQPIVYTASSASSPNTGISSQRTTSTFGQEKPFVIFTTGIFETSNQKFVKVTPSDKMSQIFADELTTILAPPGTIRVHPNTPLEADETAYVLAAPENYQFRLSETRQTRQLQVDFVYAPNAEADAGKVHHLIIRFKDENPPKYLFPDIYCMQKTTGSDMLNINSYLTAASVAVATAKHLVTTEGSLHALSESYEQLQASDKELQEKLNLKAAAYDSTVAQLSRLKEEKLSQAKAAAEQHAKDEAALSVAASEAHSARAARQEAERQATEARAELERIKRESKEAVEHANANVQAAEAAQAEALARARAADEKSAKAERTAQEATRQADAARSTAEQKGQELAAKANEVSQFEAQVQALRSQLEEEMRKAASGSADSTQRIEALEQRMGAMQSEMDAKTSELQKIQAENETLKSTVKTREQTEKGLQLTLTSLQREKETALKNARQAEEAKQVLQGQLEQLRTTNESLQATNTKNTAEIAKLQNEMSRIMAEQAAAITAINTAAAATAQSSPPPPTVPPSSPSGKVTSDLDQQPNESVEAYQARLSELRRTLKSARVGVKDDIRLAEMNAAIARIHEILINLKRQESRFGKQRGRPTKVPSLLAFHRAYRKRHPHVSSKRVFEKYTRALLSTFF